jgi:hypothetical protein
MSIVCCKLDRQCPDRQLLAPAAGRAQRRRGRAAATPRQAWAAATAFVLFQFGLSLGLARAEPLAVQVHNASEPVLCAEKDNVTLHLTSSAVRSFRISAVHPTYLGGLQRDSYEADWTACTAPGDPRAGPLQPPKRKTLYEDIEMWVVGLTFHDFWRPSAASVRIGDRLETEIHLLQVWMIRPMGGEEVLVFYPQDGYWRLRPKAPAERAPTAFGSSVLIGPIELDGRPIVNITDVVFDPRRRTFTLRYARGGTATVRLAELDDKRHTLEVTFDAPIAGAPFAALRSMYVTEFNNDVARVAVRETGAGGWREDGIMTFKGARASELWAGRVSPSRHNTSSPDLLFSGFSDRVDGASPSPTTPPAAPPVAPK